MSSVDSPTFFLFCLHIYSLWLSWIEDAIFSHFHCLFLSFESLDASLNENTNSELDFVQAFWVPWTLELFFASSAFYWRF
jgi:hypothetical protein